MAEFADSIENRVREPSIGQQFVIFAGQPALVLTPRQRRMMLREIVLELHGLLTRARRCVPREVPRIEKLLQHLLERQAHDAK